MFNMVGALCGLAIYNSIIIDLCFPTALFKKLLDEEPTLEDLKELDPVVAKSLQMLLDYEEADLEDAFCLTFEVKPYAVMSVLLNGVRQTNIKLDKAVKLLPILPKSQRILKFLSSV